MSIASEITRIKDNISNAYTKLEEKGATIPQDKNSNNLPSTIESITGGGGGSSKEAEWWNIRTKNNTDWSNLFTFVNKEYIPQNLDSSTVKIMYRTFYGATFTDDMTKLNLENVENAESIFDSLAGFFEEFEFKDMNMPNVTNLTNAFGGNTYLTKIGKINCPKCKEFFSTFAFCDNLTTIGEINLTSAVSDASSTSYTNPLYDIFNYCGNITDITFAGTINASLNLEDAGNNLTHDTLLSAVNALGVTTKTKTLKLGSSNLSRLSDEEKAIATEKGWTLA